MGATDTWVILFMEPIKWNTVRMDVSPDLFPRPLSKWVHFHELKFLVPFNESSVGSSWRLIAPNACDPG